METMKVNSEMLRTDKIEPNKKLTASDVKNILIEEYKNKLASEGIEKTDIEQYLDDSKLDDYANAIIDNSSIVSSSINNKMKERKITARNAVLSDDEMVKGFMDSAEQALKEQINAEIIAIVRDEGHEINEMIGSLLTISNNINSKNIESVDASLSAGKMLNLLQN